MPNEAGKIQAVAPTAAATDGAAGNADQTLPDASRYARVFLAVALVVAVAIALAWNGWGHTHGPFDPSKNKTANFALFAGFYVAAQVIERVLELVSPLLPFWSLPAITDPAARAAQVKADRAKAALGIAAALGVAVSCAFGLYFLQAVGITSSRTIDVLATGITIAAGTKPLHDFVSLLQNQNTPTTGSAA